MAHYIHAREKKENKKNIFLEPIAETGVSDEQIMFNLVTALVKNGFSPDEEFKEWYARQKNMRG